tara:strand:+ start:3530 stop:3781 length:252 start_codon:yes stop_codon:yes gene_type:complete
MVINRNDQNGYRTIVLTAEEVITWDKVDAQGSTIVSGIISKFLRSRRLHYEQEAKDDVQRKIDNLNSDDRAAIDVILERGNNG